MPLDLAPGRPCCTLERAQMLGSPRRDVVVARPCLEGSKSRNRLSGETHGRFLFLCLTRKSSGRRTPLPSPPSPTCRGIMRDSVLKRWMRRGLVLAAGLALAAGCGKESGTGPGKVTLSDPANTTATLQAVAATFTTPAFQSFAALGTFFIPKTAAAAGAALIEATLPRMPTTDARSYARSAQRARALASVLLAKSVAASIFPPSVLGTTYVWDPSSSSYVASTLTGAPSNGIRFIIYTLSGYLPAVPLNQIGYVDLTDQSTSSATVLGVRLVGTTGTPSVTYADYTISGTFSETSISGALAGYVTDGTTRIDFSTTYSATATDFSYQSTIDVASAGVHIIYSITGTVVSSTTETISIDYRVTIGNETVEAKGTFTVTVSGSTATITGSLLVTLNGQSFAKIEYSPSGDVVITNPSGQPLTTAEEAAVAELFQVAGDLLVALNDLFVPALISPAPAADYTLSVSPAALTIAPGATGNTTVTITRSNFTGAVTLSLGNAPTGVTGSFNPPAPTGTSSTLTVSVGPAVATGTYNLTVAGTATAGGRSTPLTLTVGASGGGGNVTMVDAGYNRSCALTASGQAYCWGGLPTPVAGGLTFAALNMGDFHTCGVTTSGAAYCWGINETGALGDGTTTDRLVPTPVAGGLTFAAVSPGFFHTCGVTTGHEIGRASCRGKRVDLGGRRIIKKKKKRAKRE